jgi:alanine dehydrogenase
MMLCRDREMEMREGGVLLLTRSDVARWLSMEACIAAVESAFRQYGEGRAGAPGILGMHADDGGFHTKAALMSEGKKYFAVKTNANFPGNPQKHGLPTIQGVVLLFDAECGRPLAVMDSIEITILRTAAATAVAAKHLARRDARVVTICGCGAQARAQLQALRAVLPIARGFAFDVDAAKARSFARAIEGEMRIPFAVAESLEKAALDSDVIVTCTPSRKAYLMRAHVKPGTFVAAVGADAAEKQELEVVLLANNKTVVDVMEQCAQIGELHHALDAGAMTREQVHADLGQLVAGKRAGRVSDSEITVFDSTGTALQDVAAAVAVYEKAREAPDALRVGLNS